LYQINSLLLSYPVKDSSRSFSYEKVVVVPVVVGALPKRALLRHSRFKGAKPPQQLQQLFAVSYLITYQQYQIQT
jgi:hypothetical protein